MDTLRISDKTAVLKRGTRWWRRAGLFCLIFGIVEFVVTLGALSDKEVREYFEEPAFFGLIRIPIWFWIALAVVLVLLGMACLTFQSRIILDRRCGIFEEYEIFFSSWRKSALWLNSFDAVAVNLCHRIRWGSAQIEHVVNLESAASVLKLTRLREREQALQLATEIGRFLGLKLRHGSVGAVSAIEESIGRPSTCKGNGNGKRRKLPTAPQNCLIDMHADEVETVLRLPKAGFASAQKQAVVSASTAALGAGPMILGGSFVAHGRPENWILVLIMSAIVFCPVASAIAWSLWSSKTRDCLIVSAKGLTLERQRPFYHKSRVLAFDEIEGLYAFSSPRLWEGIGENEYAIGVCASGKTHTAGGALRQAECEYILEVIGLLMERPTAGATDAAGNGQRDANAVPCSARDAT